MKQFYAVAWLALWLSTALAAEQSHLAHELIHSELDGGMQDEDQISHTLCVTARTDTCA